MKKLFFTNNIEVISVNTTPQCNLSCDYCIMHSDFNKYKCGDKEKQLNKLKEIISNFSSNFGDLKLDIVGGEPLLVLDHTIEIIKLFKPYANEFLIATNAELLGDETIINRLFEVSDDIEFYIGFDTTQKSVFRFNRNQLRNIRKLAEHGKVHGFFVMENKEDVPYLAEHIKAIKELTQAFPKIEYNFRKLDDLHNDKDILKNIKEQLESIPYVDPRYMKDSKHDKCHCGILNVSADGTVFSCSDDVSTEYTFDMALKFKEENCPNCTFSDYCPACPLDISRYKGDLYCNCVKIFKERI